MVALGLKGNFISRLFPKNVCVERHNSRRPTALKISTFGVKAERNDRKELKSQMFMYRDPKIPDFLHQMCSAHLETIWRVLKFLMALMMILVTCL